MRHDTCTPLGVVLVPSSKKRRQVEGYLGQNNAKRPDIYSTCVPHGVSCDPQKIVDFRRHVFLSAPERPEVRSFFGKPKVRELDNNATVLPVIRSFLYENVGRTDIAMCDSMFVYVCHGSRTLLCYVDALSESKVISVAQMREQCATRNVLKLNDRSWVESIAKKRDNIFLSEC